MYLSKIKFFIFHEGEYLLLNTKGSALIFANGIMCIVQILGECYAYGQFQINCHL